MFREPLSVEEAVAVVVSWLAQPPVVVAEPTDRHWSVLNELRSPGRREGRS